MASRVLVFGVGVIGFARTEGCIYSFTYIYMYIFSVYTENTQIKTCHVQEKRIFSIGLKARRPSLRKRSPTITYKHAKFR